MWIMYGNIIADKLDCKIQLQLFIAPTAHSQRNAFLKNYTEDYLFGFLGAEEGASYS